MYYYFKLQFLIREQFFSYLESNCHSLRLGVFHLSGTTQQWEDLLCKMLSLELVSHHRLARAFKFMLFHYRSHGNLYTFFFSNQKQLKILNTWKQNGYHQDKMLHSKPRIRDHLMCQPSLHVACGKNKLAFALWIPGKKQQEYTLASAIKNGSMEGDFWTFVHPSWTGVTADSVFPFQIVNIKRSH